MTDVSKTIAPKSDQLNADDLLVGSRTITVTKVSLASDENQPIVINYDGDLGKPYKPCKSMRRVLVQIWGADGKQYTGRSMTLFCDPKVKFGGMEVGGIRISHMSDMTEAVTLALTASRANKKPYKVSPLKVDEDYQRLYAEGVEASSMGIAAYTTWGKSLSDDEKAKIKQHLAPWTKAAKAADEARKDEDDIVVEDEDEEGGVV